MRSAVAGLTGVLASGALAGAVVLGTQLTGGAAAPGEDEEAPSPGRVHASQVHDWVACKAAKGKDACAKPTPPGHLKAKGHGRGHDEDESDEPESD